MHPVVARVTERIVQRSADTRGAYLAGIDAMIARKPAQDRMGCANLAHAYAALPGSDKFKVTVEKAPNIGIVTAYNDMLSAHQPYEGFPAVIRDEARQLGATVAVQKWRRKSEQRDKWKLRASSRAEEGLARRSFDGQEVSAPHAAYPQSCVQGTGRPGRRA